MPALQWNETDFIECLEVLPVVGDEFFNDHVYEVVRKDIRLCISVFPYESAIHLDLYRSESESALVSMTLFVRGNVERVKEDAQESLLFRNVLPAPANFRISEYAEKHTEERTPYGLNVRLSIKPDITIMFERKPDM